MAAGGRRSRFGLGVVGPRRARHVLPEDQVGAIGLPVGDDGVVIGVDAREGHPAVLGVNRPSPLEAVLVGGLWMAQVIALRAVATGARVAIETARPQAWTPLAQAAGGGQPCMTVHEVRRIPPPGASAASPVLVVRDAGARPPRGRLAAAPWQSVLTLLPYLGPTAPRLLEGAALVGVQRVSPDEARSIRRLMALTKAEAAELPGLADHLTLWCTRKYRQLVTTQPTEAEAGLLGMPHRVD